MKDWYAVSAHPRQESRAEVNLRRQGYVAWLPKLLRSRRHARRVDTVAYPLFPGYLFVQLQSCSQSWRPINSTFGVRHIVTLGGRPAPVCLGVVEELQTLADDQGIVSPALHELKIGQSLRILTGPFSERVGTLMRLPDSERVMMLLSLLGREVPVVVSRRGVAPVS